VRDDVGGSRQGKCVGLLGVAVQGGHRRPARLPLARRRRAAARRGVELYGYDPACPADVPATAGIAVVDELLDVAKNCTALVALTEWSQFRALDWTALAGVVESLW